MKPILILDNGPEDRVDARYDLSPWVDRGIVRFFEQAPEAEVDPEKYGTVFAHNGNEDEVEWAREAFDSVPVFVFSGGWVGRPSPVGNEVFLPREEFLDRLPEALARYERSGGEVVPDLFDSRAPTESAPLRPQGSHVSFSTDAAPGDPLTFPLVRGEDGVVDYAATLAPLAEVEGPLPVVIEERYAVEGDGVKLLRRLRMGLFLGGSFARWPVHFRLTSDLGDLLRSDPLAAVLLTPGVHLTGQDAEAASPLTTNALLRVLETLPVPPGSRSSSHSAANRWGPIRLWIGHRLLRGDAVSADDWIQRGRALLRDEEYWHLLSRALLRQQAAAAQAAAVVDDPDDGVGSPDELALWREFLRQRAGDRPLRVLYVDDEGHRGWDETVRALFDEVEGAAEVTCYPEGGEVGAAGLEALASERWDLVLCDLRLRPSDHFLGVGDPRQRRSYSGIDFLRSVKQPDGHAPTPVVAFTASNKSWTHAAVRDAGGAGFWVKEGPEQGTSDAYSRQNTANLLTTMRTAVASRDRRRFLWDMIEDLRRERGRLTEWFLRLHPPVQETKLTGLDQLGAVKENLGVPDRLDQIEELWLRAYGYLQARPSPFERDAYRFAPEDIAFLYLYGSLNQIRALRFRLGSKNAAMLRSKGRPERLLKGADWAPWADAVRERVSVGKKMKAARPWDAKDDHFDALYSGMLLVDAGREDLDLLLNGEHRKRDGREPLRIPGLRDLRNKLDVIHSDASHADSQTHADLDEHLRPMCEVLRCALLLDPPR